jgi:hypothetical protein
MRASERRARLTGDREGGLLLGQKDGGLMSDVGKGDWSSP